MKKYKTKDIYILTVAQVKEFTYPSWHERVTHSNILPYKYAAVKKYNKDNGFASQINALLKLNDIGYKLEQGKMLCLTDIVNLAL